MTGPTEGAFALNLVNFTRLLRAAGMPIGPDRTRTAVEALQAIGLTHRADVHAALSAVLLTRHEQQPLFDAAFDAFWQDPKLFDRMLAALLPRISGRGQAEAQAGGGQGRLAFDLCFDGYGV